MIAAMLSMRTLLGALAAASLAGAAGLATPAAAQVPHSLSLSGPTTATVGQPSVLQATGTVSDDPSVFLARYINAYALPTSVVATCPATYQNALQIKDSTFGQGGQTVALSVPVSGGFSIPIAFTSAGFMPAAGTSALIPSSWAKTPTAPNCAWCKWRRATSWP